ncbi:hypothetical protein [Streptomyces sp. NPDC050704]|uniref:hypothetical protein n=1 Tax=Streptomyces sp. NPDC050704 TaxID=3157219 RepID=UPI003427C5E4
MPGAGRIPTDAEIHEAARQLWAGGFNGKDPEKAAYANRLVDEAGSQGGQVSAMILGAAADQNREAGEVD